MGPGIRLKARWRLARGAVKSGLVVVAILLLGAVFLLRTGLGHGAILSFGLDQARSRVAGEIQVDAIRSANLLRGARLIGVRLLTPDGEPLLLADSVEASYRVGGLLRGDLVFTDIRIWRPRLLLSRLPGQEEGTLRRWLGPSGEGGGGPTPDLVFHDIRITGGTVTLVEPVDGPAPGSLLRVEESGGGFVRRIDFVDVDTQVERFAVGGSETRLAAELESLDLIARVLDERLTLREVSGAVRLVGDTLGFDVAAARLDDVATEGRVSVVLGDSAGVGLDVDLAVRDIDLADYRWLSEALPPLTGSARVAGRLGPGIHRWTVTGLDGRLEGGRVEGEGTVDLQGSPRLTGVDLRLAGVPLAAIDAYLEEPLPLNGAVTGRLTLDGPVRAPETSGRLSLVGEGFAPTVAEFSGGVRTEGGIGVEGFRATIDPLDWDLMDAFVTSSPISGPGRAVVEGTGSLDGGLQFTADLEHRPPGLAGSHVRAVGGLRRMGDSITIDVQADLAPLSLEALREAYPDLPLGGTLEGSVRGTGFLRAMDIVAGLTTEVGRLDVTGQANLRELGALYRLEGRLEDFLVSAVVPALPDSSRVTGRFRIDGAGRNPATLTADGELDLEPSRFGGLLVDSLRVAAGIRSGTLTLDTVAGVVGGFRVGGGGTLAVDTVRPSGTIDVSFETESLLGIRPIFMGDNVIAGDSLETLERELLILEGIDPDTLPTEAEVEVDGRLTGQATLTGSIRDFALVGSATLEDGTYGTSTLADARIDVTAEGLPGLAGRMHVEIETGPADVLDWAFSSGSLLLDYERPRGNAVLELRRSESEDYRARAEFELDSLGGTVELEELGLRFDTLTYALQQPATVAWSDTALVVRELELARGGQDPLNIRAHGILPRRGSADFDLTATGVRLDLLVQLLQREDALDLAGTLDVDVRIEGTAARPIITGTFAGDSVRAETVELSRVEGEIDYADRSATLTLDAWRDDLRVLRASGSVPVDLALRSVVDRTPPDPMDLMIRTDSLPALFVLALIEDLDDVEGTLSGAVDVAGTVESPELSGQLRLVGGAWTVAALGVRQSQVEATFDLQSDDRVVVSATGRSGGTVGVEGTVALSPLTDPGLDLTITLDEFRAIDRRDLVGTLSGEVRLRQTYMRPSIEGTLSVDEGILYVDEFQRRVGIVDLSDPRFASLMDSSFVAARPLLGETRNPFMQNLRVNVALQVDRNTWLRSDEMNVEVGGDLIVTYDRPNQDFVMIGSLQAPRGQYNFLTREFTVRSGTVQFVGTPGINPNLDIEAAARVRRRDAEPLTVIANLTGTLVEPRIELSSQEGGISESDLISYIAIGRASNELQGFLSGGGQGFESLVVDQLASFTGSTLASSLGSLLRGAGILDYLSVSAAADASVQGRSSVFTPQLEVGRYFIGGDYFAALTLRPWSGEGQSTGLLGGFRVEWQASDQYHVEAFMEDRFLRSGGFGFRGIDTELVYGVSIFREWGY